MGQIPPCGTGDTEILIDESKLLGLEEDEDIDIELDDMDNWVKQDYCNENIGINFSSEHVNSTDTDNIPVPEIDI